MLLVAVFVIILAAMAAKNLLVQPPALRASNASNQFNAVRAKERLATILGDQRPHPSDTLASDLVRARLVTEIEKVGFQPIVRDQFACNELHKQRGISCARVRNIIVPFGPIPTLMPGAAPQKVLLLNAHYDSTPVGPGAGDDGIGVATLLEVLWNLRNKEADFEQPVMFLFNEGEELGLIGARAFLADDLRLSEGVDRIINLEARGVRGPVNMFETSRPNAAPVKLFAGAVRNPVANSLSTDVYRLMPNYTDVNSFAERGWLTLNLAPIGNETRYHSAGDNIAALDLATLQHMGDQTLALTLAMANATPEACSGDRIFMDVAGRMLVTLPLWTGVALLVALLAMFAGFTLARRAAGRSIAIPILVLVGSTALSWILLAIIGAVRHGMFWRAHPMWTALAVYVTAAVVTAVLLATLGRRLTIGQLRPGAWLIFLIVGALIGLLAPGGIVFFLFPPLIMLAGMIVSRWWKPAELIGSLLAILALYLTWGAMLGLLEELLNSGPMWIFAPLGGLLIIPAMIEAKPLIDDVRLRGASLVGGATALILWAASAAAPAYSADRQQRFVIEHVTDARTGAASWSILNGRVPLPDGFPEAGKWQWDKLPYAETKRWLAPAPALPGAKAPALEPVSMLRNGDERTLTLRLRTNGAQRVAIIAPDDAHIRAAGVHGYVRPIDSAAADGDYMVVCSGRSCDGLELTIVQARAQSTIFTLVGSRSGLPSVAGPLVTARPRFARPQYAPDQTVTFARVKI
jgi:hypothetical protein